MTITQLQYVLAVAENGSFTRAAEKVSVTQPTLSMQIQKLEEELDTQIFDRNAKPIALTDTGKKIALQARKIIEESERIRDIVDQQKGFIGGEFKVGVLPTIMPTLLPMFLTNFIKRYPKVDLKIEELSTEGMIKWLDDGRIDVGIAATPLENDKLVERVLYYEPFEAYVPQNHRLSHSVKINLDDLEVDDILLLKDGHCFKDSVLNLCNAKINSDHQNFRLQSGSFETLVRLSDEGLGMTLLPYLHTLNLNEKEQTRIKHFEDPVPAREVSLIYPKSELKIHLIDALYDMIAGVIRGAITFQDVKIVSPLIKPR